MTFSATSIHRSRRQCGVLAALTTGLVLAVAAPAWAQFSTSADALDSSDSNGPNDLYRAEENNLRTPFDLYHRANLANTRTPEEFMQQQRSSLGSEIENLRMQQQQLLQGPPSQSAPAVEPAAEESLTSP